MSAVKVTFHTDEYEMAHGRKPKGYGGWAFIDSTLYNDNDYLAHIKWVYNVTYGEAKKVAAKFFAEKGVTDVTVCT